MLSKISVFDGNSKTGPETSSLNGPRVFKSADFSPISRFRYVSFNVFITATFKKFDLPMKSLNGPAVEVEVPLHDEPASYKFQNLFRNRFLVHGTVLPIRRLPLHLLGMLDNLLAELELGALGSHQTI